MKQNYVTHRVRLDLNDVIGLSLEDFLDHLSELATNTELLMDLSWKIVAVAGPQSVLVDVTGDTSQIEQYEEAFP